MRGDGVLGVCTLSAVLFLVPACTGGEEPNPVGAPEEVTTGLDTAGENNGKRILLNHRKLCNPRKHEFTLDIDNEFFPLPVGRRWVMEGVEDGETIRVQNTVLNDTEVVGGIRTRVMEERESVNGELIEVSRNFFAQTEEGTVCYFGEEEDPPSPGEWRADNPNSRPGIFMPADPEVGMVFQQEDAPTAKDLAGVVGEDETVTVPYGTFDETLLVQDCNLIEDPGCNPLEEGDLKVYVECFGIITDGPAELIRFRPGAAGLDDCGDEDDDREGNRRGDDRGDGDRRGRGDRHDD